MLNTYEDSQARALLRTAADSIPGSADALAGDLLAGDLVASVRARQVQSRRRSRTEDQRTVSAMFALRRWCAACFRMLMSVGINFHVTQVVDGNKGVHAMIPKSIFNKVAAAKGSK